MSDERANPDELLQKIKNDEKQQTRGKLKIFFGYAAGVGKTYAMLESAHEAKRQGVDIVAGYIEPHTRPQTMALAEGLEHLPVREIPYKGILLHDFDLDAALARRPQIILVDELAHTNAPGSRHLKRYQDIKELLNAGIHVYTTVNVQHLESLNDIIASITGIIVQERIPDSIFDNADQVELIDFEPEDLLERLNAGKIYSQPQAQNALKHFFILSNLIALREIALRRTADRINKLSKQQNLHSKSSYYTDEHILVCLSSSPSNTKIIRTAARLSTAFRGQFTALFVETPSSAHMSETDRKQLFDNRKLAGQLGAKIETIAGEDIAFQIAEYSRLSGVSKVVIGRSNTRRGFLFTKPSFSEKLTAFAPNLDIYIIPDRPSVPYRTAAKSNTRKKQFHFSAADLIKSMLILGAATTICMLFHKLHFSEANVITAYILGVLITAVCTSGPIYSTASSILSVLIFNFLFTEPRYTLSAYDSGYPITFLIMFIAAFLTSTMATKLKQQARIAAQTAYRTKILLETNQLLQQAKNTDKIIKSVSSQLTKLLKKDIIFYPSDQNMLSDPLVFFAGKVSGDKQKYLTSNERSVAQWVFKNNKQAGAGTNTLMAARCFYLAIRASRGVYGVVGIDADKGQLDTFETNLVLSILGECGLALEKDVFSKKEAAASIQAQNEQLRANLLRSISHDLRTPLTSISGNAGILLNNSDTLNDKKKETLYSDIYDDSMWLISLVENLLSITRIEDGSMNLHMETELLEEVITEALQHINRQSTKHTINVIPSSDFILVRMDSHLIIQVIINIVDNAIKYTQPGSIITISSKKVRHTAIIEIADDGNGISDQYKAKIFDMFYTADNHSADSRRGLGLGLSLCKSIIEAHGGTITVSDNYPRGTVFRFTLQAEEVPLQNE